MIRYISEDFEHSTEGIEVFKNTKVFLISCSLDERYATGVAAHIIIYAGELMEIKIDAGLLKDKI